MVGYSSGDLTDLTTSQYNKSPRNSDSWWWVDRTGGSITKEVLIYFGTITILGWDTVSIRHTITLDQVLPSHDGYAYTQSVHSNDNYQTPR